MIQVHFQLTRKEFTKAYFLASFKKLFSVYLFVFVSGAIIFRADLLVMLFYVVLLSLTSFYSLVYRPGKLFGQNEDFKNPIECSFSKSRVKMVSKRSSAEFKWSFIKKVVIYSDFYLLFNESNLAYFVPKRAFSDSQQLDFEKLLVDLRLV